MFIVLPKKKKKKIPYMEVVIIARLLGCILAVQTTEALL